MNQFTFNKLLLQVFVCFSFCLSAYDCSIKKSGKDKTSNIIALADQGQNGTANKNSEKSNFTIGGNVSGLVGQLFLTNNNSDRLPVNLNGSFTFGNSFPNLTTYFVSVFTNPPTQTCSVSNQVGKIDGKNVTDIIVICK
ncbi:hypothetical protein [Leptospira sp. 'Mane']|uniref:hypothetical protein n=1 Tax=Leptospira sp. 'Mane' TaxID=3387407 RepID=UPI00398B5A17